jgi:asparagine synthase (glutamine-hydrolysing)
MCGFTAILQTDGRRVEQRTIERMTQVIRHRGPDDSGSFFSGPVGMGFRRLSILDLSPTGHQPMSTQDGQLTVVFNGEIYNYVELRAELQARGHRFVSSGDTEVLLNAYREWGSRCVDRFNGMWAFLIYDRGNGKLFGSRDRFGIKPLYVYRGPRHVLLASEIKSIRASGLYKDVTNIKIAASYLLEDRLDESAETFYAGIEAIPAGTAFELTLDGRLRQWRYWSLETQGESPVDDPAAGFAELFEDAVQVHMRSDVPVGVNLSGGLDSTSIICSSARVRAAQGANGPLMAFCYQAPRFDESTYIGHTVDQTGATLVNLETSPQLLWADLERMLWHQDEPVHSMTAVIGYQLMRLAAQHGVKVILNGQGADETIGGYANYFRDYWHSLLRAGRIVDTWKQLGEHSAVHRSKRLPLFFAQVRHLIQAQLQSFAPYQSLSAWSAARRLRQSNRWFKQDLLGVLPANGSEPGFDLRSVLRRSVETSPLPIYLRVEDRNSMAHSVEARLPFLDYRLVELLFALPAEWHLRGPWNKFVLREAMRDRIPESVRTRPDKMGFPYPARDWFANELKEPVLDLLRSRAARERGIYNTDVMLRDAEQHGTGTTDLSSWLLRVAQFELWSTGSETSQTPRAAMAPSMAIT